MKSLFCTFTEGTGNCLIVSSLPLQLERAFKHSGGLLKMQLFSVFLVKIWKSPSWWSSKCMCQKKLLSRDIKWHSDFTHWIYRFALISLVICVKPILVSSIPRHGRTSPGTPGWASTRAERSGVWMNKAPGSFLLRSPARWRYCRICARGPGSSNFTPRLHAPSTLGTAAFSLTTQAFFQNLIR